MNRYSDEERKAFANPLRCYDCGMRYGGPGWCDVVVPNEIWERINPTYHKSAGILCFNCIATRLDFLELTDVKVLITSGPFHHDY